MDVEMPSNEDTLEAMITYFIPWEEMHHRLFFLPEVETLQVN
jgi:hypothetical protein